ncbi:hypothetical protein [Pseudomonas cedrina]|uniref:hypothetical protein n=1 Tax=Pseudomonas cedrina TaxID=651740 RepID=UPI00278528AE|nr:hypothetical protein [Pseudomonas cedrina]MDQ0652379.1 hypothetical protein [Pseudomonas cedrina]
MAKLFQHSGLVAAWLEAANHLANRGELEDQNLVLEISNPLSMTAGEKTVLDAVDNALRKNTKKLTIDTVASTIFPIGVYLRNKRPDFYQKYINLMADRQVVAWGTYALRMMKRSSGSGKKTIQLNPLEIIVQKLARAKEGRKLKSQYELSVVDIIEDVLPFQDVGAELPIYDPAKDAKKVSGYPCLSHVTFKLVDEKVHLTAIYRSHYYGTRALGNLVGLSQLLWFVAKESGFSVGTLTCISTHAELDVGSLAKGKKPTQDFVKGLML